MAATGTMTAGSAALWSSVAATAVGTATNLTLENMKRRENLKAERKKIEEDERKRKNILEEQLARRRAIIGSMGASDSGSFLSSQNKLIKDSLNNAYTGSSSSGAYNLRVGSYLANGLIDVGSKVIK
ncbi:MAG: hypothetical protein LBR70_05145 [Lactobacillaceae bacterium]|jgi:hypothetical protein|nr:hypothetical protein [Lactobacillaceae bacterium]